MDAVMVRVKTSPGGRPSGTVTWVEVPGLMVAEHFAVHPEVEYTPERRTVLVGDFVATHIPTGLNVLVSPSMESAIAGAEAMASMPINWAEMRPDQVSSLTKEIKDRVRELRLAAAKGEMPKPATLTKQEAP